MTKRDWSGSEPVLGLFLNGETIPNLTPEGEAITDDSFLLLFNASGEDREFTLPRRYMGSGWELEVCTSDPAAEPGSSHYEPHSPVMVVARSLLVLKRSA
jgi:glycogen operon protein